MQNITITFIVFFTLRLLPLAYSIRNEGRLLKNGAVQYGKANSLLPTLVHITYYLSALCEAYISGTTFNCFSMYGILVMGFVYAMLFYVTYKLHDVWTAKLYIAPSQRIEKSFLFRTVRHPNYYLNIMPELIGVGLLRNAWYTLFIGLPIYVCLLAVCIRQEEKVMKKLLEN